MGILSKKKKMPSTTFVISFVLALIVDLLSIMMPIVPIGAIFILILNVVYWLGGYKTSHFVAKEGTSLVIETVPFVEMLPGTALWVFMFYIGNSA